MTTASEWLERYATKIGAEAPGDEEKSLLLEIAATAAHASDRLAAPISCWLAGRSALSLREALDAAVALTAELGREA